MTNEIHLKNGSSITVLNAKDVRRSERIYMKFFSDCAGKCCICAFAGGGCLAGNGDDDFSLAAKEVIINRLDNGFYKSDTQRMISALKAEYGYDYVKKEF